MSEALWPRGRRTKPQAPPPAKVWASLNYVAEVLIPTIAAEYRDAHEYRFGRKDRRDDHDDENADEQISVSRVSNPTLSYAGDQEWLGDRLRSIGPRILELEKTCKSLRGSLGSLFEDPQEEYGPMRRDPIPDAKQTQAKKDAERYQSKRFLTEERDRHLMEAARLERELRETA